MKFALKFAEIFIKFEHFLHIPLEKAPEDVQKVNAKITVTPFTRYAGKGRAGSYDNAKPLKQAAIYINT